MYYHFRPNFGNGVLNSGNGVPKIGLGTAPPATRIFGARLGSRSDKPKIFVRMGNSAIMRKKQSESLIFEH